MKPIENHAFIQAFRQSAPYINAHRGKTFVILLDGEVLMSPQMTAITQDIALLNSLGIRIVLVHGSRPQIDSVLDEQQIASDIYLDMRITSGQVLDIIKQVSGKIRFELEALFSNSLPNTPMYGANLNTVSGNFITAKPLGVLEGKDFLFTGGVRRVNRVGISQQLDAGNIVLLSNLGYSSTGECFNLAAEDIALHTALAIGADKLIAYGNSAVFDYLPRELTPEQAEQLLKQKNHPTIECLLNACIKGVDRSHFISYERDGALLLELFTTNGCGILFSQNPFESIRPATIHDVGGIMELLTPLEQEGILVKRERELLEQEIQHFIVIERDGIIIACSALYPYDEDSAEIACVVTHPHFRGGQRAKQMLQFLEKRAKNLSLSSVFVLTTQTAHFFIEQGFSEADISKLPVKKQQLYNFQRNSKVFSKAI